MSSVCISNFSYNVDTKKLQLCVPGKKRCSKKAMPSEQSSDPHTANVPLRLSFPGDDKAKEASTG